MTKEELEKEAEEYTSNLLKDVNCTLGNPRARQINSIDIQDAYLAGAEPREKQIQIDAEQIRALQKQNGELTDELRTLRESVKNYGAGCYENGLRNGKRKLEQQIEKMKSALIDIKSNTDDVNIEWQIKYLFDELEIKI